jgi:hypothetical protein
MASFTELSQVAFTEALTNVLSYSILSHVVEKEGIRWYRLLKIHSVRRS